MPPRLFTRLLRGALPDSPKGRSILGDLHEEYERRRPGFARKAWYALIVTQLSLDLTLDRSLLSTTDEAVARRAGRRPAGSFDLKQALRSLARRPAYSLIAVLTLALGIGLTTSIYTVVDAVMIRPLPYERPEELVTVWNTYPTWRGHPVLGREWDRISLSWPEYVDWRDGQDLFSATAVYGPWLRILTGRGRPAQMVVGRASATLFPLLGVQPLLGRTFLPGEDGPGAPRLAVLGNGLWLERFGGDRDVVGRAVTLDGQAYEVIGVLPLGFELRSLHGNAEGLSPDLWIAIGADGMDLDRGNHHYEAIGRLDPEISLEQAEAVAAPLLRGERDPERQGARVLERRMEETRHARAPVMLLFGAALTLLLISCASVATLMIGETTKRSQELSTRMALGAGRWRVARQLLAESIALGVLGAAAGGALAVWGTRLLMAGAPAELFLPSTIAPNWRVLTFGAVLGVLTGIAFGVIPSLLSSRAPLMSAIRAHGSDLQPIGSLTQRAASVVQFALCAVLLVLAGLSVRTLLSVSAVDPGFRAEGLVAVALDFPSRYDSSGRVLLVDALEAQLASIPGVGAVTATTTLPFSGLQASSSFSIVGRESSPEKSSEKQPEANRRNVLPGFFETLQIPLLRGRTLTGADRAGAAGVVVISEAMAREYWPTESPLGARLFRDRREWEVVGIVGDVRHQSLTEEVQSTYYFPFRQQPISHLTLLVDSQRDEAELAPLIRDAIWEVDESLPADSITTLESLVHSSTADQRYRMVLLTVFASIALILAAVGVAGVTLRSVALRYHELGVRAALGANRVRLVVLVLRQQTLTLALGLIIGISAAALAGGAYARFLHGIGPRDPITFLLAAALLALVGLAACLLPARQAASVDPTQALRSE